MTIQIAENHLTACGTRIPMSLRSPIGNASAAREFHFPEAEFHSSFQRMGIPGFSFLQRFPLSLNKMWITLNTPGGKRIPLH